MTCKQSQKAGFSFIELMLGTLAMIILMLIVGLILIQGWKSWSRGNAIVEMQRGASLAHMVIAKEVRASSSSNITAGSILVCINTNGVTNFRKLDNDLVASGGMDMLMIKDSVTAFTTSKTNGVVQVNMELKAGGFQSEKTFKITPRN